MKKIILVVTILFLFLGCGSKKQIITSAQIEAENAYYALERENEKKSTLLEVKNKVFKQNDKVNLINPDRGFYYTGHDLTVEKSFNIFEEAKENGYRLIYSSIYLADYINESILPNEIINTINSNLEDAESLGVKLIIRLKYRDSDKGNDPSKKILLGHLEQLKTTLQNHAEIISLVQTGSIGAWGEWHAFTGDFADTNPDYIKNRGDVIKKLLEIFPNKFIQIRTPMHKELLFGSSDMYLCITDDASITSEIAFTDDIRAKVGHHNDCFLASSNDFGTYSSDNLQFWREYVINDSKYTPTGGETCADTEIYSNCSNAVAELKLFKWSFINENYHPDVIKRWKYEGCYEEIKENIGYKLVAERLILQKDKDTLISTLKIKNLGYAAPYIESKIEFILLNNKHSYSFIQVDDTDLRKLQPNESLTLETRLDSKEIEKGEYCLYMKIGEGFSSVALANEGTWDKMKKSNKLVCGISF